MCLYFRKEKLEKVRKWENGSAIIKITPTTDVLELNCPGFYFFSQHYFYYFFMWDIGTEQETCIGNVEKENNMWNKRYKRITSMVFSAVLK